MIIPCRFNTDEYNDNFGVMETTAKLDSKIGELFDVALTDKERDYSSIQEYGEQVSFSFAGQDYILEVKYDYEKKEGMLKRPNHLRAIILEQELEHGLPHKSPKAKVKI